MCNLVPKQEVLIIKATKLRQEINEKMRTGVCIHSINIFTEYVLWAKQHVITNAMANW